MIIRTWRGYASRSNPDEYPAHFRQGVIPALRSLDGFLGARLLRSATVDGFEFVVLTSWRSMASVQAFAGVDPQRAVVESGAARALVSFDQTVRHYEVVEDVDPATTTAARGPTTDSIAEI